MSKLEVDLMISQDGDFILCEGDDHTVCEIEPSGESVLIKQIVMNRVKTMKPDWFYDHVGANLEELLGEDNTKEVAEHGKKLITDALCADGFLKQTDIWVNPSPMDNYTIMYMLAVRVSDMEQLVFQINIALSSGVNIEEV